eukprot:TRINITY_DN7684_c0_g1_i4.p1 TRINITY_DN7684_c0_g1~~TRINITY_DN7684_c0_g1_i4.p1  ORF type:complete len:514 (+),score=75.26 TRINITY_DN7684_c0_g1_i4:84-1544(+)
MLSRNSWKTTTERLFTLAIDIVQAKMKTPNHFEVMGIFPRNVNVFVNGDHAFQKDGIVSGGHIVSPDHDYFGLLQSKPSLTINNALQQTNEKPSNAKDNDADGIVANLFGHSDKKFSGKVDELVENGLLECVQSDSNSESKKASVPLQLQLANQTGTVKNFNVIISNGKADMTSKPSITLEKSNQHLGTKENGNIDTSIPQFQSTNKYKCSQCDKSFQKVADWVEHFKIHTMGKQQFKCSPCKIVFSSLETYRSHLKHFHAKDKDSLISNSEENKSLKKLKASVENWHRPKLKCQFCKKTFVSTEFQATHIKEHLDTQFPDVCTKCDILNMKNLKKQNVEENQFLFQCYQCLQVPQKDQSHTFDQSREPLSKRRRISTSSNISDLSDISSNLFDDYPNSILDEESQNRSRNNLDGKFGRQQIQIKEIKNNFITANVESLKAGANVFVDDSVDSIKDEIKEEVFDNEADDLLAGDIDLDFMKEECEL